MRDQLKVFLGELQFHSLTVGLEWWWYRLTLLLTILLLCKLCIGLRIRYLTWIRTVNRMVREMVSFELVKEVEKDVFCLVMSVGKRKKTWVPMRNWTSDLQILCSISLPLSHRDSMVKEVYSKVHMTCFQHTARISNVNSVKFVNRIKETKWRKMFFVLSQVWVKEENVSSHKESNLRPSESTLCCSITEPQRLWWARSITKFSEWRSLCLIYVYLSMWSKWWHNQL